MKNLNSSNNAITFFKFTYFFASIRIFANLYRINLHYEQFTFYLSAGPNFSYAINGTNYYSRLTKTDYYQQEVKINFSDDIFRKAEVGILLGTGVSLPIWKLRLGVDVRYSNSLTNLLDENSQYPFKAFNKGIQLCGLVGIPLSWD